MAIEYNLNGKGKYDEERRVTTYKLDSQTKNTVDNYDLVGYNENKKNTETITPSTDFESQWKEKNQGFLKYAGDSAKKSVDKGLKEAPDYMKDADEGTSFADVQTASVKRNLAQDSNSDKLHQSALMEMIGHLSKDNKEPYLKHAQPLQKYIDVKDEFDFKHNNYTTTENVDKTPNENVRQLQRELNESGYTDKFGQPLKEDGIYAGKTAYADDSKKLDLKNKSKRYGNRPKSSARYQAVNTNNTIKNDKTKPFSKDDLTFDEYMKIGKYVYGDDFNPYLLALDITDDGMVATYPITVNASGPMGPIYEPVANILNNTDNIKVASVTGTGGKGVLESVGYKPKKLSDDGVLSPEDKDKNPLKKTMIKCMSSLWKKNNNNKTKQTYIHNQAENIRAFDDNSFTKAYFLNDQNGAKTAGHNAVMLTNHEGYGIVFSYFSTDPGLITLIGVDAEMRFAVLTPEDVDNLLNGNGKISKMAATDGNVVSETYTREAEFDITNGQGYNMYHYAVNLYDDPKQYHLLLNNCDHIATRIFKAGGINIDKKVLPNNTYNSIKV